MKRNFDLKTVLVLVIDGFDQQAQATTKLHQRDASIALDLVFIEVGVVQHQVAVFVG